MSLTDIITGLLRASVTTIVVTLISIILAAGVGLLVALLRLSDRKSLRIGATAYVEFMRGTPLILQLFFIYFVGPYIGIRMPALVAGILGLSLNYGAYISEVFRSSIQSVPVGQIEASKALGLSRVRAFRLVTWPQALKIALPPLGNYFVAMFKDTALLAVISVEEVMFTAEQMASTSFRYLEVFTITLLLYFVISYPASLLVSRLEFRTRSQKRTA